MRFAPQYSKDGKFASWDEVLLYIYKSGYSGGSAMSAGNVKKLLLKFLARRQPLIIRVRLILFLKERTI